MKNLVLIVSTLAITLSLPTGFVWAGETAEKFALTATAPNPLEENTQGGDQEQIYGVQLMTPQERAVYSLKMSAVKTLEEREQIRSENHEAMQERAKSHGLTLPGQVPASEHVMGQGEGMINEDGSMRNQSSGIGPGGGQSQ